MNENEDAVVEIVNAYGFKQVCLLIDKSPICEYCYAPVLVNKGQGTICDKCSHELTLHFSHDQY